MKVIFLDFDGVMNNDSTCYILGHHFPGKSPLNEACPDATCVALLDILVKKSGAKIVVSSSWRKGKTIEDLQQILCNEFRLRSWNSVIDKTRDVSYERGDLRGHQVQDWLDDHPEVEDYVIIDDSADYLADHQHCFVQTNPEFGFQLADLQKSYDILGVERK